MRRALYRIVEGDHPMTVRQVFYRAVAHGLIAKTEREYKQTICRLLADMRREHALPYAWVTDNTRWMRKPPTYSGLDQLLADMARVYRRALWDDAGVYIEIWLEKDALAGVLYDVTAEWDVPLMVTRGYPSLSFLYGAAEHLRAVGKPAYLYYLGDHDPSGVDIPRAVYRGLREYAAGVSITFERLAVTPEQIAAWNLPTRPTKATDSRARRFAGESVEVDAIPPETLRALVREAIERHVDPVALASLRRVEEEERRTLRAVAAWFAAEGGA